jgi:phospholipid N-methyltransferase
LSKRAFLSSFLRSPRDVGSVIPSSRFMIHKIVANAKKSSPQTILEFGGGTGVITKALRELDSELIVFEKDNHLRSLLQKQFPDLKVYPDAFEVEKVMTEHDMEELDCVICGLPLTLFPKDKRKELLQTVYHCLKPGGNMVIYQYTRHIKNELNSQFADVSIQFIPFNVPPAFVFNCVKR